MSDIIRKIRVPGGTVYDIVDQGARDLIDDVTEDAITGVSIDGDPVTVSNNTVNITSIPSGIVTNFKTTKADVDALLEDVLVLPELLDNLLSLYKLLVCGNFVVHVFLSSKMRRFHFFSPHTEYA